jgi:NADH:ubiquinone oxidoreductase subunit E
VKITNIYICVGSSCHLKGSYDIIKGFQELIKLHSLDHKVALNASFCLEHCTEGVAIKIDEEFVDGVSPNNINQVFQKYVLDVLH